MTDASSRPLVKDILGPPALAVISAAGQASSSGFDHAAFLRNAAANLDDLSVMERVRHIADALHAALPAAYDEALAIVREMGPRLTHGFQAVALSEFVARYGVHDFDRSLPALADLTRFGSAEFAIRPFLAIDPDRTLAVMLEWSGHADEHVRRLASEGSRPRLPWAARVGALKNDPTLAIPILERLNADPSLYVRKSVANHLNDIAKDQPAWLVDRLDHWPQDDPRTAWIVRHALRTLIKKGDPRALALLGVAHGADVEVESFSITPHAVGLGDAITITARLASTSPQTQQLVADYRIHYIRPNGKTAAKVFKLKTFALAGRGDAVLSITQPIQDFSTRRHHPGRHEVDLIINGQTAAQTAFNILPTPSL